MSAPPPAGQPDASQGSDPDEGLRRVARAPGLMWMAARYAYGRATYAVGEVCDAIDVNIDLIPPWQAARMANEIEDQAMAGGWDVDRARWATTLGRLRTRAGEAT